MLLLTRDMIASVAERCDLHFLQQKIPLPLRYVRYFSPMKQEGRGKTSSCIDWRIVWYGGVRRGGEGRRDGTRLELNGERRGW